MFLCGDYEADVGEITVTKEYACRTCGRLCFLGVKGSGRGKGALAANFTNRTIALFPSIKEMRNAECRRMADGARPWVDKLLASYGYVE